jgi:hypothetical protein
MSEWVIKSHAYNPVLQREESDKDKTLQEIYNEVLSFGFNTDKGTTHNYIESYASLFKPYRDKPINLLEIGVDFGYGLALWRKYFDKAKIYGIDNRNVLQFNEDVNVIFYDANDPLIINKFYSDVEFDIIIDDASHEVQHQALRFPIYFPKLKSGGIYVIEDVQALDTEGHLLKSLDSSVEVLDLRKIKDRYDDVLITYKKS